MLSYGNSVTYLCVVPGLLLLLHQGLNTVSKHILKTKTKSKPQINEILTDLSVKMFKTSKISNGK